MRKIPGRHHALLGAPIAKGEKKSVEGRSVGMGRLKSVSVKERGKQRSDAVLIHLPKKDDREQNIGTPVVFIGDEVAKIDASLFAHYSERFHNELFVTCERNGLTPVVITSQVERDVLLQFVKICNGVKVEVQESKGLDLLALAEEWEVTELVRILNESSDEILIASLVKSLECGKDTRVLEALLHDQFIRICKKECFQNNVLKIGLRVLHRVFSMNDGDLVRDHFSEVFPFLRQCVDKHFGTCASVLFAGTDVTHRSLDQLRWMETSKNFDHGFITTWPLKLIMEKRITIERYKQMISEMKLIKIPNRENIPDTWACCVAWMELRQKYSDIFESNTAPS